MRGVSGSGKSDRAKSLVGKNGIIHSTDNYFRDKNGVYQFNRLKLKMVHDQCFEDFCESALSGISPLILDNTNIRTWEYQRYVNFARRCGYTIEIVSLPHPDPEVAARRNVHGVPKESIERMIARFEPDLV